MATISKKKTAFLTQMKEYGKNLEDGEWEDRE